MSEATRPAPDTTDKDHAAAVAAARKKIDDAFANWERLKREPPPPPGPRSQLDRCPHCEAIAAREAEADQANQANQQEEAAS